MLDVGCFLKEPSQDLDAVAALAALVPWFDERGIVKMVGGVLQLAGSAAFDGDLYAALAQFIRRARGYTAGAGIASEPVIGSPDDRETKQK